MPIFSPCLQYRRIILDSSSSFEPPLFTADNIIYQLCRSNRQSQSIGLLRRQRRSKLDIVNTLVVFCSDLLKILLRNRDLLELCRDLINGCRVRGRFEWGSAFYDCSYVDMRMK